MKEEIRQRRRERVKGNLIRVYYGTKRRSRRGKKIDLVQAKVNEIKVYCFFP